MSTTTRDLLFDLAPEFETTDPTELARVDRFITYAATELSATFWGYQYQQAVALLAAHKLKMREQSADGGSGGGSIVTSRKVGPLSESYAAPSTGPGTDISGSAAALLATIYGTEYLRLRSTRVRTPHVVTEDSG